MLGVVSWVGHGWGSEGGVLGGILGGLAGCGVEGFGEFVECRGDWWCWLYVSLWGCWLVGC